jgi:hypothetical protein
LHDEIYDLFIAFTYIELGGFVTALSCGPVHFKIALFSHVQFPLSPSPPTLSIQRPSREVAALVAQTVPSPARDRFTALGPPRFSVVLLLVL